MLASSENDAKSRTLGQTNKLQDFATLLRSASRG